jgi:energy-coupling factor transporter ATP-binding protein EcfA2
LFRQALYEQQDLAAMAQKLGAQLSADRKIMLGVQLYDLISQAGLKQEQVVAFYSFMSQMGMAAQAIDIVYQLNASEDSDPSIYQHGASPLESLSFGPDGKADVTLKNLNDVDRLMAFRYHELILLKNYSDQNVSVRGRPLVRGGFCRIYPGQRILVGDQVLSYQELAQYFNAKKNVSLPEIFIRVTRDSDEVGLERSRTRESALRVTFGLKVRVKALRDVDAELNGMKLKAGTQVDAALDDRIVFRNDTELDLNDLRRRARALGGRFQLKASKSEYLVSNEPSRLEADDILLSPGTSGDVLLKIFCDYDRRVGQLEVIEADRPIMVGDTVVRTTAPLKDGDTIRIDIGQFLRCNFSERIIEEERNIIRVLEANEITHRFGKGQIGLEGISFSIARGELVCVMGASGCGKSTLMRVLAGQLQPTSGEVLLNGQSLYQALRQLHAAAGRVRRTSHHRRKPAVCRRDSRAAPVAARSHPTLGGKISRAWTWRTTRCRCRQPGEENIERRREKTPQHRARYDWDVGCLSFRRTDFRAFLKRLRTRHGNYSEHGAQQDRHRHDSPTQLETFPDVSQGDPARQRRTPRLFRHPIGHASLFRRSRTPASVRR